MNQNPSGFCDPQLDATILDAFAAEQTNSPTATQLWATADKQITDQAPFVSLVTPSINDFVSRRVGNYTFNATFGVLIDQLRVR
jgi:peptide/nickel transport system substrate-binding protein